METSAVEVRIPRDGETYHVWPLQPCFEWYYVHAVGCCSAAPHTARHCAYCPTRRYAGGPAWVGHLRCCFADRPRRELIIAVGAHIWDRCGALSIVEDLRDLDLYYVRRPGPGRPLLTLSYIPRTNPVPVEEMPTSHCWEHLLSHWHLPEAEADYRAEVYATVRPRTCPDPVAPYLPRWEHEQ